jgi:hypothetical protein
MIAVKCSSPFGRFAVSRRLHCWLCSRPDEDLQSKSGGAAMAAERSTLLVAHESDRRRRDMARDKQTRKPLSQPGGKGVAISLGFECNADVSTTIS